jgi:shikimate kinase
VKRVTQVMTMPTSVSVVASGTLNRMTGRPKLIVISGPIASGKTTTAQAIATWARGRGLTAAAIDMDDLVEIVRGRDWSTAWSATNWRVARGLAGALIDRLVENEVQVVTLAGPFFNLYERDELQGAVASGPDVRFVTLETSLEETQRRCAADETRVVTRDPAFVTRIYAGIDWKALPRDELYVSTAKLSTDEVVETIVADVGLR